MKELLASIPGQLVDAIIYGAIAAVTLIGLAKCILPFRRAARLLRRAVRALELMTVREGTARCGRMRCSWASPCKPSGDIF